MVYDAMIVVDMQRALVEAHPYNEKTVIENIKKLIETCRKNGIPVIYIRHDGGVGDELEMGTGGWQICGDIAPEAGEKVIDKKFNSAFRRTELHSYLQSLQAKHIIMCGMQTEYCLDASCKVAFELEYHVTIPRDTTTTFDNEFAAAKELSRYYEDKIWNHRYANVLWVEEIVADLNR